MNQHTLRELQQLKQQVATLHEDWGPGSRDEGVEIDDLKIRVDSIEKRVERIEKVLSSLGAGGPGVSPFRSPKLPY